MMMKVIFQLVIIFLPWKLRRWLMMNVLQFRIDPTARINFSLILSKNLTMGENSYIGNFTICNNIDSLILRNFATIGTFNYITGYPSNLKEFFRHNANRKCELIIGLHSAITSRHFIDCTGGVRIGAYTTLAGIRSQILTHSIDLFANRQNSGLVEIGSYCFIGTNCVILPGSKLPDFSVLGAKSLLNKILSDECCLYGGVPIKKIKEFNKKEVAYFSRSVGSVK